MIMLKCQDLPHSWKIQTCDVPRFRTNLFYVSHKICTFLLRLKPQKKNFFFQRIYVLARTIFFRDRELKKILKRFTSQNYGNFERNYPIEIVFLRKEIETP